jgi:hypothetical protein
MVELPGSELTLFWETPEVALDHVERFLTGVHGVAQPSRVLATVLFTDIVGSTQRAGVLGDRRWRELLNVHDDLSRRKIPARSWCPGPCGTWSPGPTSPSRTAACTR